MNPLPFSPRFLPRDYLELAEVAAPVLKSVSATVLLTPFISVLEGDQALFLA